MTERITLDPAICHGKPCIRGMRYPVEMILELLSSGMSTEDILADYEDSANLGRFRDKVVGDAHKEKLVDYDASTDSVTISPVGIRYVEERVDLEVGSGSSPVAGRMAYRTGTWRSVPERLTRPERPTYRDQPQLGHYLEV